MRRLLAVAIAAVVVSGIAAIPSLAEQFAEAGVTTTKIHFTRTATSVQDPSVGREGDQMAMILGPTNGTIYDGSLTYSASEPVQPVILHEITADENLGQPIWTVDGATVYAESAVGPSSSAGTVEFTGTALALRGADDFTATFSIDGWIRGKAIEVIEPFIDVTVESGAALNLARASVPVDIPMHRGIHNGSDVYYIITDSSDQEYADMIGGMQGWRVELAPLLEETPDSALEKIYVFSEGIHGDGLLGYQQEVFSSTPAQADEYSELREVITVTWNPARIPVELVSEEEIITALAVSDIEIDKSGVVLNAPQIVWPEGQMPVEDNSTAPGAAQVADIDTEGMYVTFVAHRGWGPDGQTAYRIVTGATPAGPAESMGVASVPSYSDMIASKAVAELYQFKNGVRSTGQLGFQPGIAAAVLGDDGYSPMWRIYLVEWDDAAGASVLETRSDISALDEDGLIEVSLARPSNSNYVVNSPLVDPFQ